MGTIYGAKLLSPRVGLLPPTHGLKSSEVKGRADLSPWPTVWSAGFRMSIMEKVRVDVWLWAVRQLKSRSLATSAARAGHVKVNGESAKAATAIKVGDEVRLRVEGFDRILKVTALINRRVGAPEAQKCYEDLTPPRLTWRDGPAPIWRDRGTGRPSKKERRQLDALRGRDSSLPAELFRHL